MDRIAWIGPQDSQEWTGVWSELGEVARVAQHYRTICEACSDDPPRLAIVAMNRSGEHSWHAMGQLRQTWDKTRVVCVLGSWCCGLRRVTPELADFPHFYVHELLPGHVFEQLANPESHGFDDLIGPQRQTIAIYARTTSYSEALADALAASFPHRIEARFGDHVNLHGVDIVLWEPHPYRDQWHAELDSLARRHPTAHRIALVNYPRPFEFAEMASCGVDAVLAQPFQLPDLLRLVVDLARSATTLPLRNIA